MFEDIMDPPARKRAYRIWAWINILVGTGAIFLATAVDVTPPWVLGLIAAVNYIGGALNFTAADNTPKS